MDDDYCKRRAMQAHKLGVEFVRARVFLMGTERRLTYDHDCMYGIARLCLAPVKKPMLAATEANEREHIRAKSRLKKMISFGKKTRCAMQQYMDLHKVTLLTYQSHGDLLPGSKRAQAKLGRHSVTPVVSKSSRTEKKTVDSLPMTAVKMKELAPQVVDLTVEQPESQSTAPESASSSNDTALPAGQQAGPSDEPCMRAVSPPPAKRPDSKSTPPNMKQK